MRFSIVVPVYNTGECLKDMLASIERQTFADYELVLIDDGSTDICPEICDQYCTSDARARVIHKENEGRLAARLDGAKLARGEYVLYVDADDMLKSCALECINDIIENSASDVVIYNADIFDGQFRQSFFEHELPEGPVEDKKIIYDKLFMTYSMNSMCLKAVRRELLDVERDYSAFYDCNVAEDLLQSVPVYIRAKNIYYLDRVLYDYRISTGSTHKYNPEYYWYNRRINLDIREQLAGEAIEDFDIKAAFHILIAAYAGTTQMKYSSRFDREQLEKIRNDSEFRCAWDLVWNSRYCSYFNKKQKLLLKMLHEGNYSFIMFILRMRGKNNR